MNKQETGKFSNYISKDFSEVGVREVRNLTETSSIAFKEQSERSAVNFANTRTTAEQRLMQIDEDNFRTILSLQLQKPGKQSVLDTIKVLERRNDILYAGPNFIHEPATVPTDPRYASEEQWGLDGTNGINAPEAWALISDSTTTIRVGVIDTGIDGAHPDLVNMMNDGLHMDFSGTGNPVALEVPTDSQQHGTHVAGIIAAEGNNDIGGAGVAWNNAWNIRLVSLRINEGGAWFVDNVIEAVNHATVNNIQVLNYSGRVRSRDNVVNVNDPAFEQAIRNYPGLFVTAAGNDNRNNDTITQLPANYSLTLSNVISVGSIDDDGARSSFSNWGENSVCIFAPGGSILSTLPGGEYGNMSGTSMASPMVAGTAALLLSKYRFEPLALKEALINGANDITISTSGDDQSVKLLNAFEALQAADDLFGGGTGSESDPFQISNASHLNNIRKAREANYRLVSNIDLSSYGQWSTISWLGANGVLDGNGYTISNMTIDNIHVSYEMRIGLFETNFGFIKNLNMTGVYIYLPSDHSAIMTDVGAVCGVNAAGGYIVNVRVSGTIKTHRLYSYTGGIVGRNRGWIQDVQFGNVGGAWGILEVNGDVGGIAGGNDVGALIKNATADCVRIWHYMIYQARAMGGIVGTSYYGQLENVTVSWTYIENFGQYGAANASPYVGIIVGNFINSSLLGAVAGNVFLVQGTLTSNQLNNFGQTPWWSWGGRAQGRCIIDGVVHNF